MRTRLSLFLAALLATSALSQNVLAAPAKPAAPAAPAASGPTCNAAAVRKLKKLNIDAMDENDRWNLEKARQKLEDAKLVAQTRGCLKHPVLAVTYVLLGVVEERRRHTPAMEAAWKAALAIDLKVQIPRRVLSAKVQRLFAAARARAAAAAPPRPRPGAGPGPARPSGPPKGFEHIPLLKWEEGKTMSLTVRAADVLKVQRIRLYFKTDESSTGRRLEFVRGGGDKWTWKVVVPGTMVRGRQLRYFIVAYTVGDKEVAASGNSANMNIVQLTSAAAAPPRRAGGGGEENPLAPGETPPTARRTGPRRVAARLEPPLENPDASTGPRRATARRAGPITKPRVPKGPAAPATFFASLSVGTGIGLMAGRTEVTNEAVPSAPSLGSIYLQGELGYLITQRFSLNIFGRIGFLPISDEVKIPRDHGIDLDPQRNSTDWVVLLRLRYTSGDLLRRGLPVNLRWFVGGGAGYGILRHLVNGKMPTDHSSVRTTDKSSGFVPNVFGGLSLCVVKSCRIAVHAEVNYLATFTSNTDENTPFHLDFNLGADFAF